MVAYRFASMSGEERMDIGKVRTIVALMLLFATLFSIQGCGKKKAEFKVNERVYRYRNLVIKMVQLPGGTFTMGTNRGQSKARPAHKVTVSPFLISKYEITQGQYVVLMRKNPSLNRGNKRLPVDNVSWYDCQKFIEKLNELEGKEVYRLPTEAEWEYACRAGSDGSYCFGSNEGMLSEYAWYSVNSKKRSHPVGKLKPNAWGIYDMHGNVWEWCLDWYSKYTTTPQDNPRGAANSKFKIFRGGSFMMSGMQCSSFYRSGTEPKKHGRSIGFRIVRTEP